MIPLFNRKLRIRDGSCQCWMLEQLRRAHDDRDDGKPNPIQRSESGHVSLELSDFSLAVWFCPSCGGSLPESDDPIRDPAHHPNAQMYANRAIQLTQDDAKATLGTAVGGWRIIHQRNPDRVSLTYSNDIARFDSSAVQYEVDPVARTILSRHVIEGK